MKLKLNQKIKNAAYQEKHRKKVKNKFKKMRSNSGDQTITHEGPGRPRQQELPENEGLLDFYKILVQQIITASTDERRRTEITKIVNEHGFVIKRSAFYLRFIPLRENTAEGKRHYGMLPVKFSKPQNKARKRHPGMFYIDVCQIVYILRICGNNI